MGIIRRGFRVEVGYYRDFRGRIAKEKCSLVGGRAGSLLSCYDVPVRDEASTAGENPPYHGCSRSLKAIGSALDSLQGKTLQRSS